MPQTSFLSVFVDAVIGSRSPRPDGLRRSVRWEKGARRPGDVGFARTEVKRRPPDLFLFPPHPIFRVKPPDLFLFYPCQKENSFSHRISEFLKSNKSPRFHGNLGLFALQDVCAESAKATSMSVFLYTWGFLSMSEEEFVLSSHLRISKKQQVPAISWQLGAFTAPRRCGKKSKSNKSCCFHMNLGYFILGRRRICPVTASPNF